MGKLRTPFRYDFVGSFLRPERLKEATEKFRKGEISEAELKAIQDEEITYLVAKEKELGFHCITDGEFRREFWHLDFMWGFSGVEHEDKGNGIDFNGELAKLDDVYLVGKIRADHQHPFVEHFRFLKQFEDENTVAKQTIPAPAQTYMQFVVPGNLGKTREFYATNDELIEDIASAYRTVIGQLYEAGCRNIQLDDCTWGAIVAPGAAGIFGGDRALSDVKKAFLKVNNLVLEDLPDDLTVNTHVCRGNYHSTFFSSGAYDFVAPELFGEENVNAYFLEFDDERSGSFAPLKFVSGEKKVVLGLVTTKTPELEDKEVIKKRIAQAAKIIPLDRLCLSPQCGFASCAIGNKLTEEQQWAKLKLVKEIAEEVWG